MQTAKFEEIPDNIQWHFPETGGGYSQGFNDSSKEYFAADPLGHVVREIIQNSLDAKDERYPDNPVIVKMKMIELESKLINSSGLAKHVEKSYESTETQDNQKGIKFYKKSLDLLKKQNIPTLKITDENTTGLKGDKWEALVHKEGTTSKNDESAGGSYGIGKNAPYVASALSTVCYSTRYLNGHREEKFIIRSKLVSHNDPEGSQNELQHIGYGTNSARTGKYFPPISGNKIDRIFRLEKDGTGIFILGFNQNSWEKYARRSIASNFFASIHDKKLIVHVGNHMINHENLNGEFGKTGKQYYDLYRGSKKKIPIEGEFGKFHLKIATGDESMENDVAYINKHGMLVTRNKQFSKNPFYVKISPGNYTALVWTQDSKTEKQIRTMEPPTHESVEYQRIDDDQEGIQEKLKEINQKIKEKLKEELDIEEIGESTPLNELAEIIPFSNDQNGVDSKGIQKPDRENIPVKIKPITSGSAATGSENKDDNGENTGGDAPNTPTRQKNRPSKAVKSSMDDARIIRHGQAIRILFNSKTGANKFTIHPVGEEDKNDRPIEITGVRELQRDTKSSINNDIITVFSKRGARASIEVTADKDLQYTSYKIVEYRTRRSSK